ncbi:MAG: hypothetical protein AB1772_05465 [Candidatus Zixiibacteriota bacterium]
MSYTTVEQVRRHLIVPYPVEDQVFDQPVILTGSNFVRFYGGGVESDSVRVKSIQSHEPIRSSVMLSGGTATISAGVIVPGSVVVASDSSLGQVYVENVDYVVDYDGGTISAKVGGALGSSQTVTVWFLPYALYEAGGDYTLDAAAGQIKRQAGGAIADGETVRLDYQPVFVSVADEIVQNAVTLANGMIESEVDPERQFEVDHSLGAAATYRALEIVCRAAASRELAAQRGGDKSATVWIKLADDYAVRSDALLKNFRPPYTGPRTPAHS